MRFLNRLFLVAARFQFPCQSGRSQNVKIWCERAKAFGVGCLTVLQSENSFLECDQVVGPGFNGEIEKMIILGMP